MGTGDLGALADPSLLNEPLKLAGRAPRQLHDFLRMMMLVRECEEGIADWVIAGKVKCPCHLAIGQEATPVGISAVLRPTDRTFGGHRSHAQYLAVGGDVFALFAEVLGRVDGCSRGMGGSQHLFAGGVGFKGSVPIVAGTVPVAVGAALAAKMDGTGDVALAFFGDGATEEGVVHESMNLASVMKLPMIFVVENNLFSSHLDIDLRQPSNSVARYAKAHGITSETVDGNDVVAMAATADRLIGRARAGEGPGFIEAVTFRWRGHVGPNEDIDVGVNRSMDQLRAWKGRDPVKRLADAMMAAGMMTSADVDSVKSAVVAQVASAMERALESPYPEPSQLLDCVYAKAND